MTTNYVASLPLSTAKPAGEFDDKTPIELVATLESYRESTGVSIQILVAILLPDVSSRTYKTWLACLADPNQKGSPRRDRRRMLTKAIKILEVCLDKEVLPKTRLEINQLGYQVVRYKKGVLKAAKKGDLCKNYTIR